MTTLPLTGPSSPLRSGVAEVRRVVNWEPLRIDSGTGKGGATAYLQQVAGLFKLGTLGAAVRGLKVARNRLFAVTDSHLIEVKSDWTTVTRGVIPSDHVEMAANLTQLVVVTGNSGYVLDLDTNIMTAQSGEGWRGSNTVSMLDGIAVYAAPDSQQFYLSAIEDATSLDPLSFASAEGSTGNIVATLSKHHELLIFKELGAEVWDDSGGTDFPLSRNDTAVIEVGIEARATLRKVGGVAYWLGRDEEGSAVVFAMAGYSPQRISSDALEQKLGKLTDMSGARAWCYHQEGQLRYVLNVPGLETTWVYNVAAGIWHERAEWVSGAWAPWRVTSHALAFGVHVVGDDSGNLYRLDQSINTNDTDVLRRNWVSPHNAEAGQAVQRFASFEVVCDVGAGIPATGAAPTMLMRYSNDGGKNWGDWAELTLGAIGETQARARDTALGSARDRVWEIVVTDDVMCNAVSVLVNER